jgi:nucleoside-diphosphate-sugar epimerase
MRKQPGLIAVTGATGFLGRALVPALISAGWRVMSLGRTPPDDANVAFHSWRLGEPLPLPAERATCVVHLACATLTSARETESAADLDLAGTMMIANQLRALRATDHASHDLLFVSSQSASEHARNRYGQQKWRLEQALSHQGEVIVRPGLIYGGNDDASVYGGLARLIRALPVLPDIGRGRAIQPIHIDDLVEAIIRILSHPDQRRLWRLGEADPAAFPDLVQQVARAKGTRVPLIIPFPAGLVLGVMRWLPGLGGQAERALGLNALRPMATRDDLAVIGLKLRPWSNWRQVQRRRRIRDARALVRAVAGRRASPWAVRRVVRWLEGPGAQTRPLGAMSRAIPSLIRILEPFGESQLQGQLNVAMAFQEVSSEGQSDRFTTHHSSAQVVGRLIWTMLTEVLILPVRLVRTILRA